MNITSVNYNQKNYAINSKKQNVQFKAVKGATLVKVLEEKGGKMSTEEMNTFLKQHFGIFHRKGVKDVLENLLPYIAGLTAASTALLEVNKNLEMQNKNLQDSNKNLKANNEGLQEENSMFLDEYTRILESKGIKNIKLNKNNMAFEYNNVKYRMDIEPSVKISKTSILLDVMDGKEIPEGVRIVEVKTSALPSVDTIKIAHYFESYNPTVSDVEKDGPMQGGREYAVDRYEAYHDPHAGQYHCFLTYEYNGERKQIHDYYYGKDNESCLYQKVCGEIQRQINDDVKSLEASTEGSFVKLFSAKK